MSPFSNSQYRLRHRSRSHHWPAFCSRTRVWPGSGCSSGCTAAGNGLEHGLGKWGDPAWTGANAGAALTGFVNGAVAKTTGDHPDVNSTYAAFLQTSVLPHAAFWSWVVVLGEIAVGLGLIFGFLTGIAAFFGGLMNVN